MAMNHDPRRRLTTLNAQVQNHERRFRRLAEEKERLEECLNKRQISTAENQNRVITTLSTIQRMSYILI